MPIQPLPPDMVARIAAGEVIERPASVVKELLDNALDAGATQVTIEVAGGGVKLIRVVDNGCGIPADEVEAAFIRHATSKLTGADDLDRITTLGFRGEALPSIAAVADVTLVSRPAVQVSGVALHLRDGRRLERRIIGCPPGTTVTVRDLFAGVPARRKFLKAPTTETGHITALVAQYALAFPEVAFSVVVEGRRGLQTPGDGNLLGAVAEVYGVETARALLPVGDSGAPAHRVAGYTSPPGVTRSGRGFLSFFINRRWVQSRALAVAVEQAYQGLLMTGRSPLAVLHLTLPYDEVDVNVHPAKREVRFEREREVFALVQRAVRSALVDAAPVPSFHPTAAMPQPAPGGLSSSVLSPQSSVLGLLPSERVLPDRRQAPAGAAAPPALPTPGRALPILRVVGQVSATYIIAEGPDGMYLVDQHAA
ncbi:MAG: DNA mismatch repair endonuclease MutL, partial [Chloroflexi bacterium]|nr:DNA mismatch repair endonuclease MutL [Chloroflexota bacterium]